MTKPIQQIGGDGENDSQFVLLSLGTNVITCCFHLIASHSESLSSLTDLEPLASGRVKKLKKTIINEI